MNSILVPILAVTVIGLICGLLLAVASVVMEVKVDERITAVRECLPGANCGSCGYTGCDGYAKAVVEAGAKTNLCIPGADTAAKSHRRRHGRGSGRGPAHDRRGLLPRRLRPHP